jgi:uncharacterized protein (DUF362 family)
MSGILSRRDFLKSGLNLAGAVSIGRLVDLSQLPLPAPSQDVLPSAAAAIGTNDHSAADILKSALAPLGGISRFVKPGQVVAIKPNATWAFAPRTASSTDPDLLRALIELVKEAGASKIIVMDHCSIEPGTAQALKANLLGTVVQETGVEGLFPDRYLAPKETYTTIELPEGKAFKKIGVIKAAVDADVRINMGVAKSHSVTRMTMVLKHMMGFLEAPSSLHTNLHKGIADINTKSQIKADLHILEALYIRVAYNEYVTCAGPETIETNPLAIKRMNQIIAGADPVLVDAYACSTFYKVKPKEFAHLKNAYDWGVGDLDVEAAKASGKFVIVNVGEQPAAAAPEPGPEPEQPTAQAPDAASDGQSPKAVTTSEAPKAIALPDAADPVKPVQAQAASQTCGTAVNPNDLLNKALIPASVILAGAGLAASRKKGKNPPTEEGKPDHE